MECLLVRKPENGNASPQLQQSRHRWTSVRQMSWVSPHSFWVPGPALILLPGQIIASVLPYFNFTGSTNPPSPQRFSKVNRGDLGHLIPPVELRMINCLCCFHSSKKSIKRLLLCKVHWLSPVASLLWPHSCGLLLGLWLGSSSEEPFQAMVLLGSPLLANSRSI